GARSSTYWPRPRTRRKSSMRSIGLPTKALAAALLSMADVGACGPRCRTAASALCRHLDLHQLVGRRIALHQLDLRIVERHRHDRSCDIEHRLRRLARVQHERDAHDIAPVATVLLEP